MGDGTLNFSFDPHASALIFGVTIWFRLNFGGFTPLWRAYCNDSFLDVLSSKIGQHAPRGPLEGVRNMSEEWDNDGFEVCGSDLKLRPLKSPSTIDGVLRIYATLRFEVPFCCFCFKVFHLFFFNFFLAFNLLKIKGLIT